MSELCCQVNPKEKCRDCNRPLCEVHVKQARTASHYLWCPDCSDKNEDAIDIIDDLSSKLDEAVEEFDVVAGLVDDVAAHTSRCRNCRSDTPCVDIYGIITNMGDQASVAHRRVMRLNR